MKALSSKLIALAALSATVALLVCGLFRGDLNQDEGWYLYGARLVAEGQTPYVDFATTQGPVMPYVYAVAHPLVEAYGVMGGRLFTVLLAMICIAFTVGLAMRLAGGLGRSEAVAAGVMTLCLLGLNGFQAYYFSVVKTYALAGALLAAGFWVLTALPRFPRGAPVLSGVLIMLAAGTRASAGFALPPLFLIMLLADFNSRRSAVDEPNPARNTWLWLFVGATLTAVALFLPFFLLAPEALWFAMVEYHAEREAGALMLTVAYKGGFVARCIQDYGVASMMIILLLVYRLNGKRTGMSRGRTFSIEKMAWWAVATISFIHFAAPFPYDDYQAIVYPILCAVLSVACVRVVCSCNRQWLQGAVLVVFLSSVALAAASPVVHGWFLGPRDRIWWPLKEKTPLSVLQETSRTILDLHASAGGKAGGVILTQDPYIAVETGLALPPGFELGQFCYFPDWSSEKAALCHVQNAELFRQALAQTEAPVAALSGYALAIRCPEVLPIDPGDAAELQKIVSERYTLVERVEPFGQADTALRLMIRH